MEFARRVVRSAIFTYLLYAAAAVSLLYALTSPIIVDPLIGFLLAGIIPGTDMVLAPETVLIVLLDLFGLVIVTLLISVLVRRRLLSGIDLTEIARNTEPIEHKGPIGQTAARIRTGASIRRTAKLSSRAAKTGQAKTAHHVVKHASTRAVEYPVFGLIRAAFDAYSIFIWKVTTAIYSHLMFGLGMVLLGVRFVVRLLAAGAAQGGRVFVRSTVLAGRGISWGAVFIIVLIGMVIDLSIRSGKYLWKSSKPYLRRFDTWLEIQSRRLASSASKLIQRSESLQVFLIVLKDGLASVRQFFKL